MLNNILICPICRTPLHKEGTSCFCENARRHCYDVASSGYINLLPPGKEKNATAGDEKNMISARREFLNSDKYAPISQKVGEIIFANTKADSPTVVDCGCGEGYHTCNICNTLIEKGITPTVLGFDASKHGAMTGAKRAKRLENSQEKLSFFAANIFSLPVADNSVDFAVSMFAPIAEEEDARILKDEGLLIVVSAGEDHLYEMREALYDTPRKSSGNVKTPEGFEKISEEQLTYSFECNNAELKSLFTMTPFYYKTSLSDKAKLDNIEKITLTADVKYTVFKKIPPHFEFF